MFATEIYPFIPNYHRTLFTHVAVTCIIKDYRIDLYNSLYKLKFPSEIDSFFSPSVSKKKKKEKIRIINL